MQRRREIGGHLGNYFLIQNSNESVSEVRGHGGIEEGAYSVNTSEVKQVGWAGGTETQ